MKKLLVLTLAVGLFCSSTPLFAQDQATQQPSAEELEKQKAEREKNAYRLLDQIIDEAQSLRLTENRVRVQINAADMIWAQNEGRGRSLFMMAAEGIAELNRNQAAAIAQRNEAMQSAMQDPTGFAGRPGPPNVRAVQSFQLRQELVLAAARHDAGLAYQLLASTKPPASVQTAADPRGPRPQISSEDNLEQTLLGRIAALDPKLAAQNAEQMMEKGQFPRTLPEVINQLRRQDAEAAEKLADKTVKRIQSANLLTNNEASTLVQVLLSLGPRQPASEGAAQAVTNRRTPALEHSAYVELLSSVVDAALKATPPAQGNQRGPANARRPQVAPGGNRQNSGPQPPTEAQIEQNSARRLLAGLQQSLHVLDQYLPAKATMVRQKMTEMGMSTSYNPTFPLAVAAAQGNTTADALIQAAASAPPQMQPRLYQQAAFKALEEGDTERARQIATNHLQNNARDAVMQRINLREMTTKAEGARLEEIRQAVARLQSDNQKLDLLLQVARDAQKTDQKLAMQVLDEARQLTNRRATSYAHFEQQLRVAHAFAAIDPARSFEILETGISHLNELLAAAAVLSGFEVNMFRDGEMSLQGGNGLTATVNRYGQELAVLARSDFERAETLASRFQLAEPRIMTRLSIVKGLLGVDAGGGMPGIPTLRGESIVIRQD